MNDQLASAHTLISNADNSGAQITRPVSDQTVPNDRSFFAAITGVVRYEFARSCTPFRVAIALAMTAFPPMLVAATLMIVKQRDPSQDELQLSALMFLLLPQAVTVLNMLLFAAPVVNAELESQSWIYAVVRPRARKALLLGKYIVAVAWCGLCTSVAAIAIGVVAKASQVSGVESTVAKLLILCWLAAFSYGALFIAIGTFFQRRAMVYAFAYALVVEGFMGWMPAVINQFTLSYRLRSLLFGWMASDQLNLGKMTDYWENAPVKHLGIVTAIVLVWLGLSLWKIDRSQYRWQTDA